MKVIVSTELDDNFTKFVVVDSFKKVKELQGVTTLIIHKYKESDFDAGVFVSQFHNNGIDQFIYISSSPSSTLQMVLKGVNGYYYEDEFYFEDEEELSTLLEDLGMEDEDENTSLATSALNVVNDFVSSFAKGDERIKAPLYLENVTSAVNELSLLTHQQELQLNTMGASALEVFEKASAIIRNMDAQNKNIEKKLEELENQQNNSFSSKPAFGNSIMFFSPYKYIGNSKILLIREYAPCRYLTSFVMGYLHHLHYVLNRRPKLIFVHQKGAGVSAKYADFTSITQESMNMSSLYDNEIIATNNPKKEVMKDLLTKQNDVIIVVDRLYGNQDIVSGRVTKINAVGSRSDIARYKVRPEDTIFSITRQPKELFTLPTIKNFPTEIDARYAAYTQVLGSKYEILDNKLGLIR
jgi:hypothetical protein